MAAAQLQSAGFTVVTVLFTAAETAALLHTVENAPAGGANFRSSQELFAIRNLLGEAPALWAQLNTNLLQELLRHLFPAGCQLVKAIYFDKPALSNWLVPWHQDLMISVSQRADLPGVGPWTCKAGDVAVRPPTAVLEKMVTIRIHLDDCDASNGALKV